jgi:hypothetical protein
MGDLLDAVRPVVRGWRNAAIVESPESLGNLLNSLPQGAQIDVEVLRDYNKDQMYSRRDELLRGTITLD